MTFADLTVLDQYRVNPLPADYPDNVRTLYSPIDQVHAALLALITSATASLSIAMFGFDDDALADAIEAALLNPAIQVTLVLDSSQASGVHERRILAREDYPASDIAVGRSEKGEIVHLKEIVVDGVLRISGSTNWSDGGESGQDNEMTVILDPVVAGEAAARHAAIFAWIVVHPPHHH